MCIGICAGIWMERMVLKELFKEGRLPEYLMKYKGVARDAVLKRGDTKAVK